MYLQRFRTQSWMYIALLALCMQMLLPFVHAMQLQADHFASLALCSSVSKSNPSADRSVPASHNMMQCPLCITSAQHHLALPAVPSVLPSSQKSSQLFQLVRNEGFLVEIPIYTLPQSHAPPLYLA